MLRDEQAEVLRQLLELDQIADDRLSVLAPVQFLCSFLMASGRLSYAAKKVSARKLRVGRSSCGAPRDAASFFRYPLYFGGTA